MLYALNIYCYSNQIPKNNLIHYTTSNQYTFYIRVQQKLKISCVNFIFVKLYNNQTIIIHTRQMSSGYKLNMYITLLTLKLLFFK